MGFSMRIGKLTRWANWVSGPGGGPRCLESGQSLIELALLVPLLLLLLLGVIEIGRYAYEGILLGNAVRAGVAYGSQSQTDSADINGITATACSDFEGAGYSGSGTCSPPMVISTSYLCQCDSGGVVGSAIDCTTGTCPSGTHEVTSLEVTGTGTFTPIFNYPGFPPRLVIVRTATLRIE